jgi:hypothetical protein
MIKQEEEHIADLGSQHEKVRLNTYVDEELNRRLDHRRADKRGTKTVQVEEALRMYLAIFDGYGDLTIEQRRAVREYLDRT